MNAFRLNNCYLFSVPLYNTYENVYDTDFMSFYNDNKDNNEEIANSLISKISLGSRMLPLNKETSITINVQTITGESVQDLTKITYCVLEQNNNNYYYYFVTSYSTNLGDRTVTFFLEWDIWQNNLSKIKEIDIQKVSQRTRADEKIYDNKIVPYDGYCNFDIDARTDIKLSCEKSVIWERFLMDADFPTKVGSSQPFFDPLKVFFRPFIVINEDLTMNTNIEKISVTTSDDVSRLEFKMGWYDSKIPDAISQHMISRELTFCSPFSWTISNNKLNILETVSIPLASITEGFISIHNNDDVNRYLFDSVDVSMIKSKSYTNLSIHKSFDGMYNGALLKFPFYKRKIKLNNEEINLAPFANITSIQVRIYNEQIYNDLAIHYSENSNNYIPIDAVRTLPINVDSLTDYLRNSKNQMDTNLALNSLSNAVSIISSPTPLSAVSSTINAVGSIARNSALLRDIENSRDNLSISNDSMNQLYRLIPIYVTQECIDNYFIDNFNHDVSLYGVSSNECVNIFSIEHLYYDYYIIPNPILNISVNSNDKNGISDILANGVRIWHCDKTLSFKPMDKVFYFKFDYFNYCKHMFNNITEE